MEMLNLKDSINQISFGNPMESERVQNILYRAGISTLEKLCRMKKTELQSLGKIGDITIERICNNLEKCGLRLGMTEFECNTYNRCRSRILHSRERLASEIERMLANDNVFMRFTDFDLIPESFSQELNHDSENDIQPIVLNIRNDLQLPKKETEPIDWEKRFYEVAKDEFLRQNRVFSGEDVRAERAVTAAAAFIEAMKAYQSKNK
jgi:hypothetical protein